MKFLIACVALASLLCVPPVAGQPEVELEPKLSGLGLITDIRNAGDGDARLFIVMKTGTITVVTFDGNGVATESGTPFLDITSLVESAANERGLLGLAFHPEYATNGHFVVHYSCKSGSPGCATSGGTLISRYTVASGDPNVADAATGEPLGYITQTGNNHNGGCLQFGPDGYLYVGMGDGGGSNDNTGQNAQDTQSLLGKMLRVGVPVGTLGDIVSPLESNPRWTIPGDNPFVSDATTRDEIWAIGLRNPWRFSFDRSTGDLWIADVGQGSREEVNFFENGGSSSSGLNYGWCGCEGTRRNTNTGDCAAYTPSGYDCSVYNPSTNYTPPAFDYSRSSGACSVTGGYVYRGSDYASALDGIYFYTDYCKADIWGVEPDGFGGWNTGAVVYTNPGNFGAPSTFGEDSQGELYVASYSGDLFRIKTVDPEPTPSPVPPPPTIGPTTPVPTTSAPTLAPISAPTLAPFSVVACPATYQATRALNSDLQLSYSVALAPGGESYGGVFCAQLVLQQVAWLGFAISDAGSMTGSEAVIGKPDDGFSVRKYYLGGQTEDKFDDSILAQSLIDASIVQDATTTTLTFAKLLVEPSEKTINVPGENIFLYAYGFDNVFAKHAERDSFAVDLTPCSNDADCFSGGTFCNPITCPDNLCQVGTSPCGPDQVCADPACSSCDLCDEAGCGATSGCTWTSGVAACATSGCSGCESPEDCVDAGCNWNSQKNSCKGSPSVGEGACSGVASSTGTCTDICVATENPEVSCSDGLDNDCDDLVDGDDPDCPCFNPSICGSDSDCCDSFKCQLKGNGPNVFKCV